MTDTRTTVQPQAVTLTVPSHPRFLYIIRSMLYPLAVDAGFGKKGARHIVLAVDEACSNIIRHAYGGDPDKAVTITVLDEPERFVVSLRDYGKKADRSAIAPRALDDIRPGGLGTHFMAVVFEAVTYDTSLEQGTLLTLDKQKQQVKT
ncbi:MAG: ATP-binding protein [Nitrospirota bacterium]|nr:ATP-binding protein [Nitrospirota bacterium]